MPSSTPTHWQPDHRALQGDLPHLHRRGLPRRSVRAAAAGHRGRVPLVERQARGRLPQRRRHPARPRHGGQHPDHGVRQPRRELRHRRGDVAQRHDRRARARGRLPDQRAGRGRRRGNPRSRSRIAELAQQMPEIYRDFAGIARAAGKALPQRAGHGVHHRAGQALAAADARRQAHGAGRGAHRRGHGGGGAHHARGGAAARPAGPGRLLPAPAARARCRAQGRADRAAVSTCRRAPRSG